MNYLLRYTVYVIVLCNIVLQFVHTQEVSDPDVVVLSDSNFKDFIAQDLTLVEFYAPWCGHCKSLAPQYAIAATELKSADIQIGKVDCTAETSIASEYGITGYPTLKVFRNGVPSDYQGQRTSDAIVSYMKKQSGPAAKLITNSNELQNIIKSDKNTNYAVLGFFNSDKPSQLSSAFTLLANKYRDNYVFGKILDNYKLGEKYGVTDGVDTVIAVLQDEVHVYSDKVSTESLESFIKEKSIPLVGIYNSVTSEQYRSLGKPIVKLFVKMDAGGISSKNTRYYVNRLKKLASQYTDLTFVMSDKSDNQREVDNYNGAALDTLLIIDDVQNNKQYKMDNKGKFDIRQVEKYVQSYQSGTLKSYVKSETAPDNNMALPVKILTGENFNDIVTDDVDALVEFYAPWCGHCKALAPKYDQLGESMIDEKSVVIGKLDATANDWPNKSQYEVSGYPTIYFKPAGGKPTKYDGPREVNDMKKFIQKNGKAGKNEL